MKNPSLSVSRTAPADEAVGRREERWATSLPLCLTSKSGEVIPAVLTDLSASGLALLVDARFSVLLPPSVGARFAVQFFVEEVQIRATEVEIVRVTKRRGYQLALGCAFVNLPMDARLALRAKVTARLAEPRQRKLSGGSKLADPRTLRQIKGADSL